MSLARLAPWPLGLLLLASCQNPLKERHVYITRGDVQIGVRTQEWGSSGIVNIQACVMAKGSRAFPARDDDLQCFFRGYDVSELSVKWNLDNDVTIALACGRVMAFRNWATTQVGDAADDIRVVHINLTDRCTKTNYRFIGGEAG